MILNDTNDTDNNDNNDTDDDTDDTNDNDDINDTSVYSHSTEKAFLTQGHKLNALCVGGPTDRISWFLNKIVGQLLRYVPAHLPNTNEFLDRLRSCRLQENCVVESFDVTALYTNVNNNEALQAVSEMLDEHETEIVTFGLSKVHIVALIKECLNCNIFKWSGHYFSQKRGLAMGQRLAPVLAICFMSRIGRPVLARMPIVYCRYIDHCCVITSTQQEMDVLFDILNRQSQHIRFTREVPHEGWLPYLNTQIKISGGRYHVKWYRKNSSKNISLHAKSAHPEAVKRAVVRNMYRTPTGVGSGEVEREESPCDQTYIGETGRMLGIRVKEHLAGKRRGSILTPLGKHRVEAHQGNDFDIKCKILAYENEIGAIKILEALHIRERNPELNNRNECIAITGKFLPFIPYCGL
uniref:Reverse transcriptase domain-containing protein n=1 Tax=Haemonchus contortus TaxID=6289 RepID=A0A7I4YDH9_HAECO